MRTANRFILLYKGLKGKASIPTDDLIPKSRRGRNQLPLLVPMFISYEGSFFPQTIKDWNALPDSLISSAEDAEDYIAKFTSLVRATDYFSPITVPSERLSFRRFPVNYPDPDPEDDGDFLERKRTGYFVFSSVFAFLHGVVL